MPAIFVLGACRCHYLVSIVTATRAPRSAGVAFGCQGLLAVDSLAGWGWGGARGAESDSSPRTAVSVSVWQRLRSSRQARTASALAQVEETQELVARAPERPRGARSLGLSGLEAGVAAAGALRGPTAQCPGNRELGRGCECSSPATVWGRGRLVRLAWTIQGKSHRLTCLL